MKSSVLVEIFNENFKFPFEFSDHAVQRINERFSIVDKEKLKLIMQAFKRSNLEKKELPDYFAIVDDTYAISFILKKDENKKSYILKTVMRGKLSDTFNEMNFFLCNAKKEKAIQEAEMINSYRSNFKKG